MARRKVAEKVWAQGFKKSEEVQSEALIAKFEGKKAGERRIGMNTRGEKNRNEYKGIRKLC